MSRPEELEEADDTVNDELAAKLVKKGIRGALKAIPAAAIGAGLMIGGGFVLFVVGARKLEKALRKQDNQEWAEEVAANALEAAKRDAAYLEELEAERKRLANLRDAGEGGGPSAPVEKPETRQRAPERA